MGNLFIIGFISILGQVVLLRELSVSFYGVELIYTLSLGFWLLFTACGAMIGMKNRTISIARLNILFIMFSIALPIDLAFIRSIRPIFSSTPGAYLPLHTQIAVLTASLFPIGLILGLQFQWAAKLYVACGKKLSDAYTIECLGGMAGGICATLFLKVGIQNFNITLLCALFASGVTFTHSIRENKRWLFPTSIISGALFLLLWKAPQIDHFMTAWTHPNLLETRDSPYSRITLTLLDGQVSVFENDALVFNTQDTQAEEFVHLAALQHSGPSRILVLGSGMEGILHEALLHSPKRIDYVELNAVLLDVVPPALPPEIQESLRTDTIKIILEDPRQFLTHSPSYDLILVGMPEPASGQTNRFYTKEFFLQCRAKLNRSGILAFRLQSSENFWTPQLTRRMVSIYRAMTSAFPEVIFLPGSTNIVIGSESPLIKDPSILASRLEARGIHANLISPAYLRYLYTNDRYYEVARMLKNGSAPVNSDSQPICYQYTIMIWLSKFLPGMKLWEVKIPNFRSVQSLLAVTVCILPLIILSRTPWPLRRVALMAAAAFIGMVFETVLILHFQTKNGILYQDIGILLTAFMAGLALGSFVISRIRGSLLKIHGIALLAGFAFLSIGIGWNIHAAQNTGLIGISGFLLLTGFLYQPTFDC
jgi:spermidine synthase